MKQAIRPALLVFFGLLTGCQSDAGGGAPAATSTKSAALRNMEQVATVAYRCWFESGDPAFSGYNFANELNSFSGKPRFLLVPESDFGGRPLLVVQARGPAGTVETFGPLLDGAQGARIRSDIARWASGNKDCSAAA